MSFFINGSLFRGLTGGIILDEMVRAKKLSEAINSEDNFQNA